MHLTMPFLSFQRTRLGKYINQVRRNISDKSLAKRMKRLVIQWRSLAQKAPSTPNGVPGGSPPSFTVPTTSPPPSAIATTSTPAQNSPPQPPPVATPLTDLPALSTPPPSSSPALPPPSRPPSKYPPSHRKRLVHKLSTVKSLSNTSHPPMQSTSQPPQVSISSSKQPSPSPSPPLMNSSQNHTATHVPSPQPPPLLANTVSPPILPHSSPPSSTSLSSPPPPPSSIAAIPAETAVPSLPISLPLNSVVQGLVVKIPLVHRKPSKTLGATQAADMTPIAGHTEREKEKEREWDRKLPGKKSQALIVSVSRLLLDRHVHISPLLPLESSTTGGGSTLPAQEQDQNSSPPLQDFPPRPTSPQKSTLSPCRSPRQVCVPNGRCPGVHGCYGSDDLWYSWTEPILGQDFAVNVLPYVYIDGLDAADQT